MQTPAEEAFMRAAYAGVRNDWDLAVKLCAKAIELDPDNRLYRTTLRLMEEKRKPGESPTSTRLR